MNSASWSHPLAPTAQPLTSGQHAKANADLLMRTYQTTAVSLPLAGRTELILAWESAKQGP